MGVSITLTPHRIEIMHG